MHKRARQKTLAKLAEHTKSAERDMLALRMKHAGLQDGDDLEPKAVRSAKLAPPEEDMGGGSGPKRNIPKTYDYNPKALKPLAKMLWALSVSLGHAITAHREFTKLKSSTISPDGLIGGRGYVMSVKDIRKSLHDACEAISSVSDTVHDEINAPHWKPRLSELEAGDLERVERLIGDAESLLDDPGAEVEEGFQEAENQTDTVVDLETSEQNPEDPAGDLVDREFVGDPSELDGAEGSDLDADTGFGEDSDMEGGDDELPAMEDEFADEPDEGVEPEFEEDGMDPEEAPTDGFDEQEDFTEEEALDEPDGAPFAEDEFAEEPEGEFSDESVEEEPAGEDEFEEEPLEDGADLEPAPQPEHSGEVESDGPVDDSVPDGSMSEETAPGEESEYEDADADDAESDDDILSEDDEFDDEMVDAAFASAGGDSDEEPSDEEPEGEVDGEEPAIEDSSEFAADGKQPVVPDERYDTDDSFESEFDNAVDEFSDEDEQEADEESDSEESDEDDEDEDDDDDEGSSVFDESSVSMAAKKYAYDRTASSLPVETMSGPRVQHRDRANTDQTGPFGAYDSGEPSSVSDEWSREDGGSGGYLYTSEWDNNLLDKTGSSSVPDSATDRTPTQGWDFGVGYGDGDDAHGQGAGGYGNPDSDGKGVFGPSSSLPGDFSRNQPESDESTAAIELAVGRSSPKRATSWKVGAAELPNDDQPGVARSDYYQGDKGSNMIDSVRSNAGSSGVPGPNDTSYDFARDVQPGKGNTHEQGEQPYIKWDSETHNMRPDYVYQRDTTGPYAKKEG